MIQLIKLLEYSAEELAALSDTELEKLARFYFTVTRPSEKQQNISAVKAKLKKAGLNPAMFKQMPQPKPEVDISDLSAEQQALCKSLKAAMTHEQYLALIARVRRESK